MNLIPNQPYPGLPAWQDLEPELLNGWAVPGLHQSLQGMAVQNSVTLFGRVQIGTSHIICALPEKLKAIRPISLPALILGGPSCLVELQGNESRGGWQLAMSAYSLGMSNEAMVAAYQGKYLSLAGSYPRKYPA